METSLIMLHSSRLGSLERTHCRFFTFQQGQGPNNFIKKLQPSYIFFFITIFSYTQETKRFFRSLTDYQILTDRRETFRATNHPENQDRYIYTYNTFFFILAFCRFKSSLDYSHNAYAQYQPTTPTKNNFLFCVGVVLRNRDPYLCLSQTKAFSCYIFTRIDLGATKRLSYLNPFLIIRKRILKFSVCLFFFKCSTNISLYS